MLGLYLKYRDYFLYCGDFLFSSIPSYLFKCITEKDVFFDGYLHLQISTPPYTRFASHLRINSPLYHRFYLCPFKFLTYFLFSLTLFIQFSTVLCIQTIHNVSLFSTLSPYMQFLIHFIIALHDVSKIILSNDSLCRIWVFATTHSFSIPLLARSNILCVLSFNDPSANKGLLKKKLESKWKEKHNVWIALLNKLPTV